MLNIILMMLLAGVGNSVLAGEFAYSCIVNHVYNLDDNGTLLSSTMLENTFKGSSFSVSRETGALIGNSLAWDTSLARSTNVINRGSKDSSFEAIADFGKVENGIRPSQFIKVEEFHNSAEKPFIVTGDLGVATGICN